MSDQMTAGELTTEHYVLLVSWQMPSEFGPRRHWNEVPTNAPFGVMSVISSGCGPQYSRVYPLLGACDESETN